MTCPESAKLGTFVEENVNRALKSGKQKINRQSKRIIDKAAKKAQSLTGDRNNSAKVSTGKIIRTRAPKPSSKSFKDPAQLSLFEFHRDPDPVPKKPFKRLPNIGWRTEHVETGRIGEKVNRVMSDGSIRTFQTGQYHLPWIETTNNVFVGK